MRKSRVSIERRRASGSPSFPRRPLARERRREPLAHLVPRISPELECTGEPLCRSVNFQVRPVLQTPVLNAESIGANCVRPVAWRDVDVAFDDCCDHFGRSPKDRASPEARTPSLPLFRHPVWARMAQQGEDGCHASHVVNFGRVQGRGRRSCEAMRETRGADRQGAGPGSPHSPQVGPRGGEKSRTDGNEDVGGVRAR